jgi:ABC-type sugar transport system substrate-binding protein
MLPYTGDNQTNGGSSKVRVTFLNPADGSDAFFGTMVAFMRRAASTFGIDLEVIDCHRQTATMREKARALVSAPNPPEYLLLVNEQGVAVEVLPPASARGIKILLLNEGLMVPDRQALGSPGERHPGWLGELVPDDRRAGYLLAKNLIEGARRTNKRARDGRITLVGLGGSFTTSSLLRINGLRQAVAESPDVNLAEVVPANWEIERARSESKRMIESFPEIAAVWSASDHMALGAIESFGAAGQQAGKDYVIGGVDWAPFAFDKVRQGIFSASLGGHFLDGAWALVVLYDHKNGAAPNVIQEKSQLALATRENVDAYEALYSRRHEIDFSRFSKAKNRGLEKYRFEVDAVL